jgi:hypothetical protein
LRIGWVITITISFVIVDLFVVLKDYYFAVVFLYLLFAKIIIREKIGLALIVNNIGFGMRSS